MLSFFLATLLLCIQTVSIFVFHNARAENPISYKHELGKRITSEFLRLLHAILDIRLPNYRSKIIKVPRALLCQRPIHKALATHIWVATHGLRNAGF